MSPHLQVTRFIASSVSGTWDHMFLPLSVSDVLPDSVGNSCMQTLNRRDNAKSKIRCTHNNIIGVDNDSRVLLILVWQSCGKLWACWIIQHDRTDWSVRVLSVSFARSVNALSADSWIPARLSRCTLYHRSKLHRQADTVGKTFLTPTLY